MEDKVRPSCDQCWPKVGPQLANILQTSTTHGRFRPSFGQSSVNFGRTRPDFDQTSPIWNTFRQHFGRARPTFGQHFGGTWSTFGLGQFWSPFANMGQMWPTPTKRFPKSGPNGPIWFNTNPNLDRLSSANLTESEPNLAPEAACRQLVGPATAANTLAGCLGRARARPRHSSKKDNSAIMVFV